jgi:hypothetical protein
LVFLELVLALVALVALELVALVALELVALEPLLGRGLELEELVVRLHQLFV